ncbi:MAG TPA: NAD-dependent epimerase/dehydratase family protein [Candidatus Saccharimonadales bacterium]|nr:NAD-dependent epimerase/dehydratase family protein [Candidatus Saccharimonadales bacterium]
MKELIIGNGFLASNYEALMRATTRPGEVHQAGRFPETYQNPDSHYVDLLDPSAIRDVLEEVRPDVIVNGAAILGRNNDRELLGNNPTFVENLLHGVHEAGLNPRIVTMGSAAVYGPVDAKALPASEADPMQPTAGDLYGRSKKEESERAHQLAQEYGLDVVEARVFNPLGPGMHGTNLITVVMNQIRKIKAGEQEPVVTVRNTEVSRDYVHVHDVVEGINKLAHTPHLDYNTYNVGSGIASSNGTLIHSVLAHSGMDHVAVQATDATPEPTVGAMQANSSRLRELGWKPQFTLDQTVASMVAEAGLAVSAAAHHAA